MSHIGTIILNPDAGVSLGEKSSRRRRGPKKDWHKKWDKEDPPCSIVQWRTRDRNVVINIFEMADSHLRHAFRFASSMEQHKSRFTSLMKEIQKRNSA